MKTYLIAIAGGRTSGRPVAIFVDQCPTYF